MSSDPEQLVIAEYPDLSFLRDFADIIKNRLLIFSPFFGVFLVFLFNKNDYVFLSPPGVKILCGICFLMGINYAATVSKLLSVLETLRVLPALAKRNETPTSSILPLLTEVTPKIGPMLNREGKLFKRTMFCLYFTAIFVLGDIYFGKWIAKSSGFITHWIVRLFS